MQMHKKHKKHTNQSSACPVLLPERLSFFGAYALQGSVRIQSFLPESFYAARPSGVAKSIATSPGSILQKYAFLSYFLFFYFNISDYAGQLILAFFDYNFAIKTLLLNRVPQAKNIRRNNKKPEFSLGSSNTM